MGMVAMEDILAAEAVVVQTLEIVVVAEGVVLLQ